MNLLEFVNMRGRSPNLEPSARRVLGGLYETVPSQSFPVSVESSDWITIPDPERLVRVFEFEKYSHLSYFVNELLKYQEDVKHHSSVTIDHRSVRVETYTRHIDSVTSQDLNLAKFCDELYNDVRFIDQEIKDEL